MTTPRCAAGRPREPPAPRLATGVRFPIEWVGEAITARTAPRAADRWGARLERGSGARLRTCLVMRTGRRRGRLALERAVPTSGRTTGPGCFPAGRPLVPGGGRPARRAPHGTPAGRGRGPGTAA